MYTFLNDEFDLFIFINETEKEKENERNNKTNEIIEGLIEVAVKHFEEIEKENKSLI